MPASWPEFIQGLAATHGIAAPDSGSLFGGGQPGVTSRDVEMMGRGGAPPTAGGILAALGNAYGIVGSGAVTTGLASMGELASGATPGSSGGFSNIPGHFAYDKDLIDAVKSGRMTRAQADAQQQTRNAMKSGLAFASSMKSVDVARHVPPERRAMVQALADAHGSNLGSRAGGSDSFSRAAEHGPAGRGSGQMRSGQA